MDFSTLLLSLEWIGRLTQTLLEYWDKVKKEIETEKDEKKKRLLLDAYEKRDVDAIHHLLFD